MGRSHRAHRKGRMGIAEMPRWHRCETQLPQSAMCGKFARVQMRSIYKTLHLKYNAASLSDREESAPKWRISIIRDLSPSVTRSDTQHRDFAIYPDVDTNGNRIAALLFKGAQSAHPFIIRESAAAAPKNLADAFHRTNRICGLVILSVLAFPL